MISNDQLGRQWREGIVDGPHALDSVLVSLIAWGPDRTASLVGTGFIVAGLGRQAIAVSASHNFEHIARVQQPWSVSHPTALSEFIVSRTRTVSIDPRALRALYINGNLVDACTIDEINVVSEIDVAVFTIRVQEDASGAPLSTRLAIDTSIPVCGQDIVAMSYASMEVLRQEAGEDGFDAFTVKRRLALRRGVITEVYPRGYRAHWPCFETSIPIDGGMSGGPALRYDAAGKPMVACGVVSQDFSSAPARNSYAVAGCSTMAMLWPALGLAVHARTEEEKPPERLFLQELIRRNIIEDIGSAETGASVATNEDNTVTITVHGPRQ